MNFFKTFSWFLKGRWPIGDNFCLTWIFKFSIRINSLCFHLFSFIIIRLFSYILILLISAERIDNWQYIVDDGYFLLSCSHCSHTKIDYTSNSTPQSGKIYTQRLLEAMKIEGNKHYLLLTYTQREREEIHKWTNFPYSPTQFANVPVV